MIRLTVARDRLAPALSRADKIALTRAPIAIVSTVKLVVDKDGLRLTATDFDTQLEERVDIDPRPDWAGCVDAARFVGIVTALPRGSELIIGVDENRIEARCGRA